MLKKKRARTRKHFFLSAPLSFFPQLFFDSFASGFPQLQIPCGEFFFLFFFVPLEGTPVKKKKKKLLPPFFYFERRERGTKRKKGRALSSPPSIILPSASLSPRGPGFRGCCWETWHSEEALDPVAGERARAREREREGSRETERERRGRVWRKRERGEFISLSKEKKLLSEKCRAIAPNPMLWAKVRLPPHRGMGSYTVHIYAGASKGGGKEAAAETGARRRD